MLGPTLYSEPETQLRTAPEAHFNFREVCLKLEKLQQEQIEPHDALPTISTRSPAHCVQNLQQTQKIQTLKPMELEMARETVVQPRSNIACNVPMAIWHQQQKGRKLNQ